MELFSAYILILNTAKDMKTTLTLANPLITEFVKNTPATTQQNASAQINDTRKNALRKATNLIRDSFNAHTDHRKKSIMEKQGNYKIMPNKITLNPSQIEGLKKLKGEIANKQINAAA